jgi:RNA polymerase sigma factor (sigma-70 family)
LNISEGNLGEGEGLPLSGGPVDEFTRFYEAHRAEVFRTAYLMTTNREDAKDLTQETFTRALQHWKKVSEHENPGAWLQLVVGRLAISLHRRVQVRSKLQTTREETVILDPAEPAILEALRSLSAAQRIVVVLRFYRDQSVESVARMLGKRPGTVKALTAQALARLRPILEEKGVKP